MGRDDGDGAAVVIAEGTDACCFKLSNVLVDGTGGGGGGGGCVPAADCPDFERFTSSELSGLPF